MRRLSLAIGAAGLVAAALGGCSSSEAREAADASELGYSSSSERRTIDDGTGEPPLDEELVEEMSAEAGIELQGDPVPCVDPPREVRAGRDWVVDTSQAEIGIRLRRPPTWEVGADLGGWAVGGSLGPSILVLPMPLGDQGAAETLPKALQLGGAAAILSDVAAVERLDEDTCFISGRNDRGQQVAVVVHLPDRGSAAMVMGVIFDQATPQEIEDLEVALRLAEFGPS